ncbi:MAG: threonine--tRNA ligase, partial [Phycisphaerae bacterium]
MVGVAVLKVTLPDGTIIQCQNGATTLEVAEKIGPRLARDAVAGRLTNKGHAETVDLNHPLPGDCALRILTRSDESQESLKVLRHSAAHVMAEAICKIYPDAKLVYGPPVEDGFYYDIDLEESIRADAFERIEARMQGIIAENRPFSRYELPREEAMAKLAEEDNRYKIDNAERAEGDTLSFYVTGEKRGRDFEDLCRGPHVPATGVIGAFRVQKVSASYYRGDANEKSLQRVYGTAFFKKKSLDQYLHRLEEAKKRDHRVLGRQLELFHIDEAVGQGLVLWAPAGATVRKELQDFISQELRKQGYQEVFTPHIGKLGLYRTSGHLDYYEDSQFPQLHVVRDNAGPLLTYLRECRNAYRLPDAEREEALVRRAGILESEYPWEEKDPVKRFAIVRQFCMEGTERCTCAQIAHRYDVHGAEGFLLRPMNCPHHIKIYSSRP